MANPNISVIIVSYNSAEVIEGALRSVADVEEVAAIYVVDNASTDNSCALIRKHFPNVKLTENTENIGFACANNLALEQVKTDFTLLLNPDAVPEKNTLKELLAAAERYPDAAILAPQLCSETGVIQRTYKRNLFDREQLRDKYVVPKGDVCAEFLSGAVLLLNMKHMREVGFFDPNIFLFYEDDDLCLHVRQAGYGLVYAPSAKAMHRVGQSSPVTYKTIYKRQYHLAWSRLYLQKKYKGTTAMLWLGIKLSSLYFLKILGYALTLNRPKCWQYVGRLCGIAAFLIGKKTM